MRENSSSQTFRLHNRPRLWVLLSSGCPWTTDANAVRASGSRTLPCRRRTLNWQPPQPNSIKSFADGLSTEASRITRPRNFLRSLMASLSSASCFLCRNAVRSLNAQLCRSFPNSLQAQRVNDLRLFAEAVERMPGAISYPMG
jgi:hypothetical protein